MVTPFLCSGMLQETIRTSRKRGPCTPLMRVISISAVADGPEMNVVGSVAVSASLSNASEYGLDNLLGEDNAEMIIGDQ